MNIQGHRGFSSEYPENTLLAFREAYKLNAYIEIDVQRSIDGVYCIMHNSTIDATTNGTGSVGTLTWDYLSTLDAGGHKGVEFEGREDCKIPTLDDVLTDFQDKIDATIVLNTGIRTNAYIQEIIDKVISYGMLSRIQFFSEINTINFAKSYKPELFTMNSGMPDISNYSTFLQNAIDFNHNAVSINPNVSESDLRTMVLDIKSAGKLVHASYLSSNYSSLTQLLIDIGVDYVLGNDVRAMANVLIANGLMPPFTDSGETKKLVRLLPQYIYVIKRS